MSMCAVCFLAVQNSAAWQGNHISQAGEGGSGATWENARCARNLPNALQGGSLSQNDQTEPKVISFSPECFF